MTYCSSSVVSVQSLVQTWDFLFILASSQTSPFLSTVQHIGYLQQKRQHKVQKLLTSLTDRDIVMQTSLIYTTNVDFSAFGPIRCGKHIERLEQNIQRRHFSILQQQQQWRRPCRGLQCAVKSIGTREQRQVEPIQRHILTR